MEHNLRCGQVYQAVVTVERAKVEAADGEGSLATSPTDDEVHPARRRRGGGSGATQQGRGGGPHLTARRRARRLVASLSRPPPSARRCVPPAGSAPALARAASDYHCRGRRLRPERSHAPASRSHRRRVAPRAPHQCLPCGESGPRRDAAGRVSGQRLGRLRRGARGGRRGAVAAAPRCCPRRGWRVPRSLRRPDRGAARTSSWRWRTPRRRCRLRRGWPDAELPRTTEPAAAGGRRGPRRLVGAADDRHAANIRSLLAPDRPGVRVRPEQFSVRLQQRLRRRFRRGDRGRQPGHRQGEHVASRHDAAVCRGGLAAAARGRTAARRPCSCIYRTSHEDGERLVADPRIGATGYTGSREAGL